MSKEQPQIGTLDRKINIYETTKVKSPNGELIETEVLYKNTWANSKDRTSNEEEEGKIWLYAARNYTIRYDATIVQRGEMMIIRDFDGDYNITGIELVGRKHYIILKTIKRE